MTWSQDSILIWCHTLIKKKNAQLFNEDCERFDSALEAFENDVIPQSAWDSIVPSIAEEDALTHTKGFDSIQVTTE